MVQKPKHTLPVKDQQRLVVLGLVHLIVVVIEEAYQLVEVIMYRVQRDNRLIAKIVTFRDHGSGPCFHYGQIGQIKRDFLQLLPSNGEAHMHMSFSDEALRIWFCQYCKEKYFFRYKEWQGRMTSR